MLDMTLIRLFFIVWGLMALTIRLFYASRARNRKAQEGVAHTIPHILAVLSMAVWMGIVGLTLIAPESVAERLMMFPGQKFVQIIGLTLLSFGLWLLLRSHQALGEFYGVKLYIKQEHRVIDIGPYAYVRHPMYATYLLWFAASFLLLPHPILLVVFLTGLFGFHRMAGKEEKMLSGALGAAYDAYRARTGMFWPGFTGSPSDRLR